MAKRVRINRDPLEDIIKQEVQKLNESNQEVKDKISTINDRLDSIAKMYYDNMFGDNENKPETVVAQGEDPDSQDENENTDFSEDTEEPESTSNENSEETKLDEVSDKIDDTQEAIVEKVDEATAKITQSVEDSVKQKEPEEAPNAIIGDDNREKLQEIRTTNISTSSIISNSQQEQDTVDVEPITSSIKALNTSVISGTKATIQKLSDIKESVKSWLGKIIDYAPLIILGVLTLVRLGQMLYEYVASGRAWADVKEYLPKVAGKIAELTVKGLKTLLGEIFPWASDKSAFQEGRPIPEKFATNYNLKEGIDYTFSDGERRLTKEGAEKIQAIERGEAPDPMKKGSSKSTPNATNTSTVSSNTKEAIKASTPSKIDVKQVDSSKTDNSSKDTAFNYSGDQSFSETGLDFNSNDVGGNFAIDASSNSNLTKVNVYNITRLENPNLI